jgi:hypothetical protein
MVDNIILKILRSIASLPVLMKSLRPILIGFFKTIRLEDKKE